MDLSALSGLKALIEKFESQDYEDRQSQLLLRSALKELDMSAVGSSNGGGAAQDIAVPFETVKAVFMLAGSDFYVKFSSMGATCIKLSGGNANFDAAVADAAGITLGVGKFSIPAALNGAAARYFAIGN